MAIPNTPIRPALLTLFAMAAMPLAAAAQSGLSLRDYIHTEWTQHDGVPLGNISSMAQSSDGRLWLRTHEEGLLRFDGMRFVRESGLPCEGPPESVRSSPTGVLWGICGDRLIRRTPGGRFEAIDGRSILLPSLKLRVDSEGRPWSFDNSIRFLSPATGKPIDLAAPTHLPTQEVIRAGDDFWLSDGVHVFRMQEHATERHVLANARCLAPAKAGGVLAAADNHVWHLSQGTVRRVAIPPPGVTLAEFPGCMVDHGREGVWMATRQHGVARLLNGRIETFSDQNTQRLVTEIMIDRTGTVWAGSTSGLQRFRKPMVQKLGARDVFQDAPTFVFADSTGAIWTGPLEQRRTSRTAANGDRQLFQSPAGRFDAVGEDNTGRVWLSDSRDIGYVRGRRFVAVRDASGARISEVRSFTRDASGRFWALARGVGLYQVAPGPPRLVIASTNAANRVLVSDRFGTWIALQDGGVAQYVNDGVNIFRDQPVVPPGGTRLASGSVRTIVEDGDSIWLGTFAGLKRWRHGRWTHWTSEHGLPGDGYVQDIATDRTGRLWMMTRRGILVVPRAQFDATRDGQPQPLSFAQIGVLDGVAPHPGNMGTSPRVSRDRDGRILFTTMDAIVRVDPSELTTSSFIPTVAIDAVTVDNRVADDQSRQTFVEPSRMQFDYTSLDLPSPENSRFRYRLDGYDADWTDAGGRRSVTYGTLRPGRYQFTVIGAGSTGVWSERGATFAFEIAPVFWRSWWFRVSAVAFGALLVVGVHRLRVRQVSRTLQMRFDERLAERSRVARDLHDTLLQTVQGSKLVADHALERSDDSASMRKAMTQVSAWLGQASKEGRDAVDALRTTASPTENLTDAIKLAIDESGQAGSLRPSLSLTGDYRPMHPPVRDDVYQIGSEAIRNACAHSGGTRVEVALVYAKDLILRVVDDGVGLDPGIATGGRPGHFGLPGMRERAERIGATLDFVSTPNGGTTVTLTVPGRRIYRHGGNLGERIRRSFRSTPSPE